MAERSATSLAAFCARSSLSISRRPAAPRWNAALPWAAGATGIVTRCLAARPVIPGHPAAAAAATAATARVTAIAAVI